MPRGGARTGKPGETYTNRADLNAAPTQPVRTGPSRSYGSRTAQESAQSTMPLPQTPQPGAAGPLDRPTERPGEPIHAGLTTGPGPGREALGMVGGPAQDALYDLKRLYQVVPDDNILAMIRRLETDMGLR